MLTKKPIKKTNLNFKIFLTSIFLIFIFFLSISTIATAATCGNGVQESGEECDQNSATRTIFSPIQADQCSGGTCNQATCKCSGGGGNPGGGGTNPAPTGPASFSADKTSGTTPLTVNFTLTNGTNCINYMCDTGVGAQQYVYEKSFSCKYTSAGSFTASISCNGNKITKTITATGNGTGTTPTPTANPTRDPNLPNVRPVDYVNLHESYHRAPEDDKVYDRETELWTGEYKDSVFGNSIEIFRGFNPYFRVFIPPGTITMFLLMQGSGKNMAVAHHKTPPAGFPASPPSGYEFTNRFRLNELEVMDCHVSETDQGNLLITGDSFLSPYLTISRAGWLYVKVGGGDSQSYGNHFRVLVNTKVYNAWWDKYIKDEAGWNTYIENVETYIDPTIETKTPTCKANFSKTDITAPGESKLSFSSENTTKLVGSCTGPLPIKELELPLSYTDYAFPFTKTQTGTEICTFTPYNGTTKGESCSATVTVGNSSSQQPTCQLNLNPNSINVGETTKIAWQFGGGYTKTTPTKIQCPLLASELVSITGMEKEGTYPVSYTKAGKETCKIYFNNSTTPACESNVLTVNQVASTLSATISQSINSTTSTGTIGETFRITWSSEGATKCEITKLIIDKKASYKWGWLPGSYSGNNLNGSANASPSVIGTHVFKITCTDKDQKTVEKSITHEVNSQQTQQAQGLSCPEGDDPNCDKHTCKDVWCATGCGNNMKKGTKDCSGV
jgi:hypothetical protein